MKQNICYLGLSLLLLFTGVGWAGAQTMKVSGTVTDADNADALIGVSVKVKGTSTGAVTDLDGHYNLSVQKGATLVFTYIDYAEQEAKATAPVINIALKPDQKAIEEVVVVGYGVQKKSSLTGAVSQVKAEDMENRTAVSLSSAISGKTTGITSFSSSAAPGAAPAVQVRGISSIAMACCLLGAIMPAQGRDTIPEIRVSLINVAPGSAVYAAAGHAALRLECPSAQLDYVFSYEMTLGLDQLVKFALGKANGGYLAAPTADYLAQYTEEQRTVYEREIFLTPQQKQALWRWLDTEIVKQMPYRYDYAHHMCSTMAITAIEQNLGGERIDWGTLPPQTTASSRTAMRFGMRHAPWARLFWDTILGTEGDRTPAPEENMCPELLELSLRHARIITADGAARPFFVAPAAVLRQGVEKPACWFTPWVCFALVLAAALLLSLLPASRWVWLVRLPYDLLLFGLSGLLGLMLIWMICFSGLVGTDWSWLILPFCPLLPLAALLITRRCRRCAKRLWLAETCITALCIPLALAIPQYASPYILIFLAMAVRSYCRCK